MNETATQHNSANGAWSGGVPLTQSLTGNSYGSYPYTYYWTYPQRNLEAEATQLIALYKKQFGADWKEYFRDTVKIQVR